jgi:cytoskeleton protein RodZ
MSEDRGIGAALRAAREEKGWTANDVGSRLRLMSRQVEAIENEEFSKLGPPVFARGFVRNYAKLLGLDPDDLLEQMTRIKTTTVQDTETVPFTPGGEFWKSPWLLGGIAAVIVLIAIPVALYLWLNSGEEEQAEAAVEQTVPPPPPPPAPVLDVQPPPAGAPAAGPAPVQPAAPAPVPQTPAPAAPPAVSVPPPQSSVPAPAPAPAVQPSAPVQPAPATQPPAPAKPSALRMQFDEAAWVQVRDNTGRVVQSGLNPTGSTVQVNGKAPFYLVVGNAAHVHLSYKGKPVDLAPFTDVNVARLTLNP